MSDDDGAPPVRRPLVALIWLSAILAASLVPVVGRVLAHWSR